MNDCAPRLQLRETAAVALVAALILVILALGGPPAQAQSTGDPQASATTAPPPAAGPRRRSGPNPRDQMRASVNENVLFVLGGQLGASFIQLAHDMSVVVNEEGKLRVMPVVGQAGAQNIKDLVFLRGIDLAITSTDVLNHFKRTGELGANLDRQISYITALGYTPLQILARGGIEKLEDLKGKRINFNNRGSSTAMTAPQMLKTLGVTGEEHYLAQPDAIERMRRGEIDATLCMCPPPIPAFQQVKAEWGFRLLELPYAAELQSEYVPLMLTHAQYPELIGKDEQVESVGVSNLLVTFNWPRGSERFVRTAKFVEALFSRLPELQKPPRHASWKTVNLAANVPGWQRFPTAQEWLERNRVQESAAIQTRFKQFVAEHGGRDGTAAGGAVDDERLFRDFLEWMNRR